jgi:hypothetical protein
MSADVLQKEISRVEKLSGNVMAGALLTSAKRAANSNDSNRIANAIKVLEGIK